MNEKHIREVLEVEKQAEELLAAAKREVERLPLDAETDARGIIEQERAAAREEARRILEEARSGGEAAEILARTQERMGEAEKRAAVHLEKAVAFVLERVIGKA